MTATIAKEKPIIFTGHSVSAILRGQKTMTRRVAKTFASPSSCTGHLVKLSGDRSIETDDRALPYCPYGKPGDRLYCKEAWAIVQVWQDPDTRDCEFTEWTGKLPRELPSGWRVAYQADGWGKHEKDRGFPWRSPLFMPRWASRLTLEITEVRVERLQEITEAGAIAEGLEVQIGEGTGPGPGYKWTGPGYWDGYSRHLVSGGKTYHTPGATGLCKCFVGERESLTPAVCAFRHAWDKLNVKRGFSWESNCWVWAIAFRRLEAS